MWIKLGVAVFITGGIASIGLYLAGITGGYFRLLTPQIAFMLYSIGMLLGVIITVVGLIDASKNGSSPRTILLVCAIIPAFNLIYAVVEARKIPMINDISTDLIYPPEFQEATKAADNTGKNLKFPLGYKSDIEEAYPDIAPLALIASVDDVHINTIKTIEGMSNWAITSNQIGSTETIIEGTVTSTVFGFVDDFVIRLKTPAGGFGCVVDMRSRSRIGKGDMGKNAEHIRDLMQLIQ